MRRQFDLPREQLDTLAIDRAAKIVRDVFTVVQKSGQAACIELDGAAGAAGLLAVAHAAYKEATMEVEMEHEVHDPAGPYGDLIANAGLSEYAAMPTTPEAPARGFARVSRLRTVPMPAPTQAATGRLHDDGTACTCDPGCTCHPPTRNEDPIVTGERGSWHLDTCPVSPKNRGGAAS